jgi:phosphate transport system permease protein
MEIDLSPIAERSIDLDGRAMPLPVTAGTTPFRLPPRSRWNRLQDPLATGAFFTIALTAVVAVLFIFIFVGKESLPVLLDETVKQEASLEKFFLPQVYKEGRPPQLTWQPVSKIPKFSFIPLIVGTLKVTLVAILFAVPLAILAALFSVEFAPRRVREVVKPVVELLAGIPSVVLGFLALMLLAPRLQALFGFTSMLNAIVAGLAVGIAILPIVYTVCEDAFNAVPGAYREASIALGADRFQTALRVVLPAALPGVFAAVVLGFGRAIGETMIVLMASGNAAILSADLTDSVRTLSATIAAEMLEVVYGDVHYSVLFFMGTLLFLMTFALNLFGAMYVGRLRAKLGGR